MDAYAEDNAPAEGREQVLAMIVQPNEFNAFDQRHVMIALEQRHGVRTVRIALQDIAAAARIEDGTNRLLIKEHAAQGAAPTTTRQAQTQAQAGAEVEVAVAYFRAGYTPDDYSGEAEWAARLLLEKSAAVKCPNIAMHLAGTKKVQQVLAMQGVLERFLPGGDSEAAAALRATFAPLHSLDPQDYTHATSTSTGDGDGAGDADAGAAVARVVSAVEKTPSLYVLKPQREGGGSNLYGKQAAAALKAMSPQDRLAYIVQGRILPPSQSALVLGEHPHGAAWQATSELGLFGISVRRGTSASAQDSSREGRTDYVVDDAGVLLRTKPVDSDEVGFAAGFGVLDTVWLMP